MIFSQENLVNELIIRIQPNESIYLKLFTKSPGLSEEIVQSELDLSYKSRFKLTSLPDAYERLILDVMLGNQNLFVRNDELEEAWRIFTPILHKLEKGKVQPEIYPFGTRGPPSADKLIEKCGVKRNQSYKWTDPSKL